MSLLGGRMSTLQETNANYGCDICGYECHCDPTCVEQSQYVSIISGAQAALLALEFLGSRMTHPLL